MSDKSDGSATVAEILQLADKAEFLEYVRNNIDKASHCVVVFATPDGHGGLSLDARQLGMRYMFEIMGFFDWISGLDWEDGSDNGQGTEGDKNNET